MAVLNAVWAEGGGLFGTWIGTDEKEKFPTAGPFLLSDRELSLSEMRRITQSAMLLFLQNAETDWRGRTEG